MNDRTFPYNTGFLDNRPTLLRKYGTSQDLQKNGYKFLIPKNTLVVREFRFLDNQSQLIQLILNSDDIKTQLGREDKKFKEGMLKSQDLCGKIKTFKNPKNLENILRGKERPKLKKAKIYLGIVLVNAIFLGGIYAGYYLNSDDFKEKIDYVNELVTPFAQVIQEMSGYKQNK